MNHEGQQERHERCAIRKNQLVDLAREGNEEAAADLFKEFGVESPSPETDEACHD
jgi:hypothetical protein